LQYTQNIKKVTAIYERVTNDKRNDEILTLKMAILKRPLPRQKL